MDHLIANPTNPLICTSTPVFGDNVPELLGTGTIKVHPSATIVVNSIDDVLNSSPGVTTLRDAINKANADSGEDLIVFDRSLFSNAQTITLKLGELDITHSLDIIAPRDTLTGGDLVTVSGNKASRVFDIESQAKVTFSGLIVADGSVTGDNGGGIKNSGTLTLDNSIVRNNSASGIWSGNNIIIGSGGGIFNSSNGTLRVSNTTISGNLSRGDNPPNGIKGGGGIFNSGTVDLSNSTISGNLVDAYYGDAIGGGIFNNGTLRVSNCDIRGNGNSNYPIGGIYSSKGGGIFNSSNGTLTVSNSTIRGNDVSASLNGSGAGGGIYNSGTVLLSNTTIRGNGASTGSRGGSENRGGGGIYNSGNITMSNCDIGGNSASGGQLGASNEGGGIVNMGTLNVSNSTINSNSASDGQVLASRGGGGILNMGTLDLSNSIISRNSALKGGGISNSGTVKVSNSTISGNSAFDGGGIYNSGTSTVLSSTISGNSVNRDGGGIYNGYTGTLTLLFSTLTQNIAANGGGVYQDDIPPSSLSRRGSNSVRNTIIASNLNNTNGANPDVSGTFTSNGYNLIGDGTGSTGFGEATWDIVGTSDWPVDPRLDVLAFNGGSTQTIALLPDSPAIGAADPIVLDTDPTTDQRGLPRRAADGTADIGAFQLS